MTLPLYLAFVAAVSVLMLIPGPNVALIVANSISHGSRYGLMTVLGTSAAMVLQLAVTAIGMAKLLGDAARAFELLRWFGVAYLLWLGVSAWRAAPVDLSATPPEPRRMAAIFARGFFVSLSNPKTLLFYGAFFPQFLDRESPVAPQLAALSATFLVLALLIDGAWALLAARFRSVLGARGRLRNRLTGGVLVGAALGLALARR
jgi:threonine/homoserine/homoserine lactone efflux protein